MLSIYTLLFFRALCRRAPRPIQNGLPTVMAPNSKLSMFVNCHPTKRLIFLRGQLLNVAAWCGPFDFSLEQLGIDCLIHMSSLLIYGGKKMAGP